MFRPVASRTTPKPNPRFHGRNAVASLCTSAKRCRIARLNQALWLAARFFEARPHWCLPLPASLSTFMHESGCVQTWPCPLSGINRVHFQASMWSPAVHPVLPRFRTFLAVGVLPVISSVPFDLFQKKVPSYLIRSVFFPATQNRLHSRGTNRRRWKLRFAIPDSKVGSVSYSGDTTPCRMTGVTSHHHVLYKEILARNWCPHK